MVTAMYQVRIRGEGVRVPITRRTLKTLGRRKRVGVTEGFLTTRFVEAPSAAEASQEALRIVEAQLADLLGQNAILDIGLSVEDVSSDPPILPVEGPPGDGFTWY
jgi:hypothetical protein